jgi:hypothetical protein
VTSHNVFHTPGVFYRPATLKSMTCLLGNSEKRTVFQNFDLQNLNSNEVDYTHLVYDNYLKQQRFIPPFSGMWAHHVGYWAHMSSNMLPTEVLKGDDAAVDKGLFNLFPLSLIDDTLKPGNVASSTLGKPNTSLPTPLPPSPPPPKKNTNQEPPSHCVFFFFQASVPPHRCVWNWNLNRWCLPPPGTSCLPLCTPTRSISQAVV